MPAVIEPVDEPTSPVSKVQEIILSIVRKKNPRDSDFKRLDDAAYESIELRRKAAQSKLPSGKKQCAR